MLRTARAIATNQVARTFPRFYMQLAGQTGRGGGPADADEVADYFLACLDDLAARVGCDRASFADFVAGKDVLEYGPGSIPGMAMLLLACGARRVTCVDRFPLLDAVDDQRPVFTALARRLGGARGAALEALARDIGTAGIPGRLDVVLHPSGLSGLAAACDLVVSRAVLEEVNDLPATFADMARALRAGGLAVHQVDLRGYGLEREHALDFLVPTGALWRLMYSHKCVPNRVRVGEYRRLARASGLREVSFEPGIVLSTGEVEAIRPRLAPEFRDLPADELACLTFWLCLVQPGGTHDAPERAAARRMP